jgi:hypothetical protein
MVILNLKEDKGDHSLGYIGECRLGKVEGHTPMSYGYDLMRRLGKKGRI